MVILVVIGIVLLVTVLCLYPPEIREGEGEILVEGIIEKVEYIAGAFLGGNKWVVHFENGNMCLISRKGLMTLSCKRGDYVVVKEFIVGLGVRKFRVEVIDEKQTRRDER